MRRSWRHPARWLLALFVTSGGAVLPGAVRAQPPVPVRSEAAVRETRTGGRPVATSAARTSSEGARELADPAGPPPPEPFPIGLEIAVATSAPLSIGGEVSIELPLGLLVRGHVGFVPEPYLDLVNGVLEGIGAYGEPIARLVERTGANAWVVRASGGIRPVPGYGFEIVGGYTYVAASTRVSAASFEVATGQPMLWPGLDAVGIDTDLHLLHVQVGWTGRAWDHLAIRVLLGWAHTVSASASVEVPAALRARSSATFADIEGDIEDALTRYGFTPELSVAIGYRL